MERLKASCVDILGLFPSLDAGAIGGVQASGRDAWQGIVHAVGEQHTHAVCYQEGNSKLKALLQAIGSRASGRIVLVWHLHLLKLLPFLDHAASPVILFLHGVEAWCRQGRIMRSLLKRVDLIVSNTDYTWRVFIEHNPAFGHVPHRTVLLGMGSSLERATALPAGPPAVLMVSRLDKREDYKGHRQLIDAWRLVLRRIPEAKLWIVGDGDLRPCLEDVAGNRVTRGAIRFFGSVSETEKEQLISQCRCLAMPSRGEGFGLVYLEAMRMGRPCLVSRADAGREVVNPPEAGLAVDPDQIAETAEAVCRLLSSGTEWNEWSRRARTRYETRFTVEHFHHRLLTAMLETDLN